MMRWFSNQSPLGRILGCCWILFASNLLFLLTCLPVVTAGAGLAALSYTTLRTLRGDGELNPISTFWRGFRDNWKQATIAWLSLLMLALLLYLELFWCSQLGSWAMILSAALSAIALVALVIGCYLFPVIAAFHGTLPQLVQNSFYFAMKRPLAAVVVVFLHTFPLYWTWLNTAAMPLYAFLWCTIGFSALSMCTSKLILPLFIPYLPRVDRFGTIMEEGMSDTGAPTEPSQAQILSGMKRLDG